MTDEEREDLNTFKHDLVKQARWWQWKAETLEKENKCLEAENAALRERLSHSLELPYMEQTVSQYGTEDTILYYMENGKLQQECFNNKFPEQLQTRLAELKEGNNTFLKRVRHNKEVTNVDGRNSSDMEITI